MLVFVISYLRFIEKSKACIEKAGVECPNFDRLALRDRSSWLEHSDEYNPISSFLCIDKKKIEHLFFSILESCPCSEGIY